MVKSNSSVPLEQRPSPRARKATLTNNSFIDGKTFDGFRKVLSQEFSCAYVINLKGNARTSGERRRREGGNIFHNKIRVGVAIYFLIKKKTREKFRVYYDEIDDYVKDDDKLQWISSRKIQNIPFEVVRPDKNSNWINIADNDFENLLPLCGKDVKYGKSQEAVFELYTNTIKTNRDEWVFDFDKKALINKTKYFITKFNYQIKTKKYENDDLDYSIKWSSTAKEYLYKRNKVKYDITKINLILFRPFTQKYFYAEKIMCDRLTDNHYQIVGYDLRHPNSMIHISGLSSPKPFSLLGSKILGDYHFIGDTQCLPLYRYDEDGNRLENITDWGLEQFVKQYKDNTITRQDIFHYVYAVLHNPAYRKKYELNLKRDFPRIPFYDDFRQWAAWGEQLMNLHINYETVEPYQLRIRNYELGITGQQYPKVRLKADKATGIIILDSQTELRDIPDEAWDYKLGNRSALEWILDQYREKKPQDPTIAEKFNTYRFADYKEQVIDLLKRVCAVSVQTMQIVREMENKVYS